MSSAYKVDIGRVIDTATEAVVHYYQAAIRDERERLARTIWLASVALGAIAFTIALHQESSSVYVSILRIVVLIASIASLFHAAIISTRINLSINQYQQLITAALTQKSQILSHDIDEAQDPQLLANQIFEIELCKPDCLEQVRKAKELIKRKNATGSVKLANYQLWETSLVITALILQSFITFDIAVLATHAVTAEINKAYRQAVTDAAFPDEDEISTDLIAINKSNSELIWNEDKSRILVTTWKSQAAYEKFLKPDNKTSDDPEYAVWVTTAPQVKRICNAFIASNPESSKKAVDLRLRQYLGLNPQWQYDVFVEMWVNPYDIFRPCVDPQIDDKSCNLHFDNNSPEVKNITEYRDFYRDIYYKSYRKSSGVPWTGLGYTYDWGNPNSEVGASEYILAPGTPYEIKQVVPTMDYCGE